MSKTLSVMKKIYQTFAFLCVICVFLVFMFSVDIPVYENEPFTDGNGITWINDKGEQRGYQIIESQPGVYQLKIYADKTLHTLIDTKLKIDLPLAAPLTTKNFSLYNGKQVILSAPLLVK